MSADNSSRVPVYSIGLVSASALAYEILLSRLFSIIQWHHFAYMIISLALLGYGVSGSFIAILRNRLLARFQTIYLANLLLFALCIPLAFSVAQRVPFNPEEIIWDSSQWVGLLVIYLVLALPFFFVANAIGLALLHFNRHIGRLYAFDLFGAGLGGLGVVAALFLVYPQSVLILLSLMGLIAFLLAWWEFKFKFILALPWFVGTLIFIIFLRGGTEIVISPYKGLSGVLRITESRIRTQKTSPLGLITVVESPKVPLRYAPGLSLYATSEPPPQLGVFTDADSMTAITRFKDDPLDLTYLDQTTSALPYHLSRRDNVLILGVGGGGDVLQALYNDVETIDAVELNPQVVELVRHQYADYAGNLYNKKNVRLYIDEARGFVKTHEQKYDLIQLALMDSFGASSAGLYALNESYLYTIEAFSDYLARLSPGGYLAITRWIKMPPRDILKIFATAVAALEANGVKDVGTRLLLVRSWQTGTLVIKNGAIEPSEINQMRKFCEARGFDVAYFPGIGENEVNLFNVLRQPYFYSAATALIGDGKQRFLRDYKFNLVPATDDRPYFFHFFKWRTLPEIIKLMGQGGISLLESGYLILVATLLQALLTSLILVALPLVIYGRNPDTVYPLRLYGKVLGYFSALGLAFLFIEIAFIQKFILFLHHPIYAIIVVLSGFLLSAGLGSYASEGLAEKFGFRPLVNRVTAIIAVIGMAYLLALDPLFTMAVDLPIEVKIVLSFGLIVPLAFFMGMPFPLALRQLGQAPALIPWAWGINGCMSVVSAVLATLLAIHFGFTCLVMIAGGLYLFAAWVFPE